MHHVKVATHSLPLALSLLTNLLSSEVSCFAGLGYQPKCYTGPWFPTNIEANKAAMPDEILLSRNRLPAKILFNEYCGRGFPTNLLPNKVGK